MAELYACAIKIEGKNRGEERDDTCDHGLSRSWKVDVCSECGEKKTRAHSLKEVNPQKLSVSTTSEGDC